MANVNVDFMGRAVLEDADEFHAAYDKYRQIAITHGLTVLGNGFAIESWAGINPDFPKNIVFQWRKTGVNQTTLEETYTLFQTIAANNQFAILSMNIVPA